MQVRPRLKSLQSPSELCFLRELALGAPESGEKLGKLPLIPNAGGGGIYSPLFEDFKESKPQARSSGAHCCPGGGAMPPRPLGTGRGEASGTPGPAGSLVPTRQILAPVPPRRSSRGWPSPSAALRQGPASPPSLRPPYVTSWKPSAPVASLTTAPPFRPNT